MWGWLGFVFVFVFLCCLGRCLGLSWSSLCLWVYWWECTLLCAFLRGVCLDSFSAWRLFHFAAGFVRQRCRSAPAFRTESAVV